MSIRDKLISDPPGFGSAPLGNMFRNIPAEEAAATVDAVWQQGICYFDTAPLYGAGLSEILALVQNYIPSYQWVIRGGWNIADCVERTYDLEGMSVGVVAAGRIGLAVLRRLKPFDVKLHYTQRHRLPPAVEQELGLTFPPDRGSLAAGGDG